MSHTRDWSASQIATYDQEITAVDAEVGHLVQTFRIGAAEAGEPQAAANIMVFVAERSPVDLAALLVAALRRLARIYEEGQQS